ncbi:MAG: DNA translocase FtsK 4TM domain-containing protein [Deltaproteobacteria bacterium]|nr:DNA translocase FtsK 4TM domain-containing protein [Deltaproteobacteria bacterium]
MENGTRINRELWGAVALVGACFAVLSLASYSPLDRSFNVPSGSQDTLNLGGVVGAYLADALLQGFGLTAYLVPLLLVWMALRLFRREPRRLRLLQLFGSGVLLWGVAILISLVHEVELARDGGGALGGFSRALLTEMFGYAGTCAITVFLFLLAGMLLSQTSMLNWWGRVAGAQGQLRSSMGAAAASARRLKPGREAPVNVKKEHKDFEPPPIILDEVIEQEAPEEPKARRKKAKAKPRPRREPEQFVFPELGNGYTLPPMAFLDSPPMDKAGVDKASLEANCLVLQRKLQDFGIEGEVLAARPGPVITVYEFRPAPGVMVRRIVGVADDLAMALSAVSIRILAPIPGESVVGIEVPNTRRETVVLREILEDPVYSDSGASLPLALGKDVSGAPFATDLARMPHLLVAGATGTGKSVSLNSMILSILYRATPDDVRFIMIDPKMLELTPYEGLPHLLTPVVTDPKEARAALFWAVQEMDRRYRLMRDKGARNIDNYNRILEKEPPRAPASADPAEEELGGRLDGREELVHVRMPRVVILIDELADLMMSVGRDIEEHITRLAQKARAAGIHMVLATQRPSVDVITGLIKANFPARVSFQVTSRIDSRTILDGQGAEQLLGNGDLLFLPPGTARLIRLHGPYVSNREIGKVTDFIKQQGRPEYRPDILEAAAEGGGDLGGLDDDYDEMYDQAVAVVTETRQASISMVQRRLRVGYNRAARMIEKMEREGVVGPAEGAKPREVLAPKIEE